MKNLNDRPDPATETSNLLPLSAPSNMQPDLLDSLDLSRVEELYGKASEDPIGGGRSSVLLPRIGRRAAARHIRAVRDQGISFNYLLNTSVLDNAEFTASGRRRIERFLSWIVDTGADTITVTIPFLLELVKRQAPHLRVSVSTMAQVDRPDRAAFWRSIGADRITLSVVDVNRDFPTLAAIRQAVDIPLQVIANLECLQGCPFSRYHANINSHASSRGHSSGGFVIDYCYLSCSLQRVRHPVEWLRAGWIRPEDQGFYKDVGMDSLKLVNRAMASPHIARVVAAYTAGHWDGNLLDLFSKPEKNLAFQRQDLGRLARFLLKPGKMNPLKLIKHRDAFRGLLPIIDNRALDGFLQHFVEGKCRPSACADCDRCERWAQRAVRYPEGDREAIERRLEALHRDLLTGELHRYP